MYTVLFANPRAHRPRAFAHATRKDHLRYMGLCLGQHISFLLPLHFSAAPFQPRGPPHRSRRHAHPLITLTGGTASTTAAASACAGLPPHTILSSLAAVASWGQPCGPLPWHGRLMHVPLWHRCLSRCEGHEPHKMDRKSCSIWKG